MSTDAEAARQSTAWEEAARAPDRPRLVCQECEELRKDVSAARAALRVSRAAELELEKVMGTLPRSAVDFTGCTTVGEKLERWRDATLTLLQFKAARADLQAAVEAAVGAANELRMQLVRQEVGADNAAALECERWRARALAAEAKLREEGR
jgi:hypothetical protein